MTQVQYQDPAAGAHSRTQRIHSVWLGSHLSPSRTECYITSDMFYVEVHLDKAGKLVDVKVAHHGENPVANAVETILRGSVGLLTARSGGHLVSLQCYVSPDDIFEEGTGAQLNFTDVNIPRTLGVSVSVTVEGTTSVYKLPIAPLITGSHPVDNKGVPMLLESIPVFETAPTLSPLYDLIIKSQLHEDGGATSPALAQTMRFYASLPGQQHCYFLNGDAPVQDGRCLQGALVSKIPFRHPAQVPALLDIIRHQAAYNTLIGSCVKKTHIKEGGCVIFHINCGRRSW
ncbi:Mediator of RNA polymerase II transcription subunit 1 [Anabarilius grahami]|uniref:Mediator of RNA polymerase II transcription subunit 1 n=1 Tax=Anabarilius grahami TaxID=495550 RepID=A0A3N0YP69_ANAGA|nr:Mediator of RNA polymerase II transcription subunit 1 [Anabarilius grahami]